jgi:hypothetical protein
MSTPAGSGEEGMMRKIQLPLIDPKGLHGDDFIKRLKENAAKLCRKGEMVTQILLTDTGGGVHRINLNEESQPPQQKEASAAPPQKEASRATQQKKAKRLLAAERAKEEAAAKLAEEEKRLEQNGEVPQTKVDRTLESAKKALKEASLSGAPDLGDFGRVYDTVTHIYATLTTPNDKPMGFSPRDSRRLAEAAAIDAKSLPKGDVKIGANPEVSFSLNAFGHELATKLKTLQASWAKEPDEHRFETIARISKVLGELSDDVTFLLERTPVSEPDAADYAIKMHKKFFVVLARASKDFGTIASEASSSTKESLDGLKRILDNLLPVAKSNAEAIVQIKGRNQGLVVELQKCIQLVSYLRTENIGLRESTEAKLAEMKEADNALAERERAANAAHAARTSALVAAEAALAERERADKAARAQRTSALVAAEDALAKRGKAFQESSAARSARFDDLERKVSAREELCARLSMDLAAREAKVVKAGEKAAAQKVAAFELSQKLELRERGISRTANLLEAQLTSIGPSSKELKSSCRTFEKSQRDFENEKRTFAKSLRAFEERQRAFEERQRAFAKMQLEFEERASRVHGKGAEFHKGPGIGPHLSPKSAEANRVFVVQDGRREGEPEGRREGEPEGPGEGEPEVPGEGEPEGPGEGEWENEQPGLEI